MNTKWLFTVILCLTGCLFTACDRDSDSDNGGTDSPDGGGKGYAPASIIKREITFTRNGTWHFSSYMNEDGAVGVLLNTEVSFVANEHDPACTWQKKGDNTALYTLEFLHKVYVPYYGTYTYGYNFYSLTLTFTSASGGTYTGTRSNGSDTEKREGTFSIK
jgi:hypothetical protein